MKLKFPEENRDNLLKRIVGQIRKLKLPSLPLKNEKINFEELKANRNFRKIAAVLVVFIVIFALFSLVYDSEEADVNAEQPVQFKVKLGMDAAEIARALEKKNVIDSSLKFRVLAKWNGYEDQLKTGSYTLHTGMTYDEVFEKLLAGEVEIVTFTIPEGFGVKDIAKRLSDMGLVDKEEFLDEAKKFAPYDYIEKHSEANYYCEGFLFPDTYEVDKDIAVEKLLKLMAENFDYRLTEEIRERAKEENLSIYDLITMASLIEKEVRFAQDRPIVAQVFFKRLKIGMPLQTDASLQYLMDAPKEDVSIEDTKIKSPYNTYLNMGLPPGPIANPGLDAIEAVLNPANTDYLYFVADRNGHNHYANTYDEHLELVNKYR